MSPKTIGIIMDGNRRWAKEQGLPTLEGHRKGYEKLKEVLSWAKEAGVKNVVVYALSIENWNRAKEEVSYLLDLIRFMFDSDIEAFHAEGGVIRCVGALERFPEDIRSLMTRAEEKTKNNVGPHMYIALSYGGREEIVHAVKLIVQESPKSNEITEDYFARHLRTHPMPDPDLIIRTSGEQRLSGFLPWQSTYSELFFTKTYWPAFSKEEFNAVMEEFKARSRRFGV